MMLDLLDNGAMMHIRSVSMTTISGMSKSTVKVRSMSVGATKMGDSTVMESSVCWYMMRLLNNNVLVGKGMISFDSNVHSRFSQLIDLCVLVMNLSIKILNLTIKSVVGDSDVVKLDSGSVKLGVTVIKSTVKMVDLVTQGVVGGLEVMALSLASSKLVLEVGAISSA
jgi:hypothetical protein